MPVLEGTHFLFKADASNIIGAGHVMRCLTLADALHVQGGHCEFICREHKGDLRTYITSRGYTVHSLPFSTHITPERNNHPSWLSTTWKQDAQETINIISKLTNKIDWLFVDHYGIDARWHNELRPYTTKIAVVDDLADRLYNCDLLIDQLPHRIPADYKPLVPTSTRLLLGGRYAMLRPVFAELRNQSLNKIKTLASIKRVLISMGGTDLLNATHVALELLTKSNIARGIDVDILSGQQAEQVKSTFNDVPFNIHIHPVTTPIHELMLKADIAIGAGGLTAWERCCLGLPTFLMTIAQNQHDAARALQKYEAAVLLGDMDHFDMAHAITVFNETINDMQKLKILSANAAKICDGTGIALIIDKLTTG
jgi:UDP-2,4-diacetamido-2,4,6-trideoxy-beta-L-altropyranose hydrolase